MKRRRRQVSAQRPNHRLRADSRYFLNRLRKRQVRIALQLLRLEDHVPHRLAVGADEPTSVIVKSKAELSLPAGELEVAGPRIEARVARCELDRRTLRMRGRRDSAAVETARQV